MWVGSHEHRVPLRTGRMGHATGSVVRASPVGTLRVVRGRGDPGGC